MGPGVTDRTSDKKIKYVRLKGENMISCKNKSNRVSQIIISYKRGWGPEEETQIYELEKS